MFTKQRFYAGLLFVGASVLMLLTVSMLVSGALEILMPWVSALLLFELLLDLGCMIFAARWWFADKATKDPVPLRLGAAAAILHAIRVAVFVLGRLGPWQDFDVRPEHRALHYTRWNMGEVYFASVLSVLGILGVIVIWSLRRRRRSKPVI